VNAQPLRSGMVDTRSIAVVWPTARLEDAGSTPASQLSSFDNQHPARAVGRGYSHSLVTLDTRRQRSDLRWRHAGPLLGGEMMAVWELIGFNTDQRYDDVRWREYTTSKRKAERFAKIPKLQFSDSGHGIVFNARPHSGPRKPVVRVLSEYVAANMPA